MIWSILFLIVVGVLLPILAVASWQQTRRAAPAEDALPSSAAIAVQTLTVHAVVMALAVASAVSAGLTPVWFATPSAGAVLLGVAILAAFAGIAFVEVRRPLAEHDVLRRRLRRDGLSAPWLAVSASAAVAEEFAYRGVLFLLLASVMDPLLAALAGAALFALGHLAQGPAGAALSGAFALAMHGLYAVSGALLLPMAVHFLYDAGVAFAARRL